MAFGKSYGIRVAVSCESRSAGTGEVSSGEVYKYTTETDVLAV